MIIKDLLTNRRFNIAFFEYKKLYTVEENLYDILSSDDFEYHYSLQDIGETMLSMEVGQTIYHEFNRDNPSQSKGILTRVK